MKTWAKVALTLWSLLFITISVWFLYLVGFDPQGSSTLLALGAILMLCVGAIAIVVHSQSDLEDTERQLQTVRLKAATASEEARKQSDSDLQALRASSAKEITGFKLQAERADKLQAEAEKTVEVLRESNEMLNNELLNLQCSAKTALACLGKNAKEIRGYTRSNVDGETLRHLRFCDLNAALALFDGLGEFTWKSADIHPSVCRDFVTEMIRDGQVDITKPWIADFIRFAHRKDGDEQATG